MNRPDRRDQLTRNIEKNYAARDPWILPRTSPPVEKHMMDMFEVKATNEVGIEFQHLFNDKIYSLEIREDSVRKYVRKGDVFLTAMIQQSGKWQIWYMSPPYS